MSVNLDVYVFTTKYVLKEKSPILKVYHEEEGDWQFLGKENNLEEEDAMLISLGEILEFDNTLKDILSLPLGGNAHRACLNSPWIINK